MKKDNSALRKTLSLVVILLLKYIWTYSLPLLGIFYCVFPPGNPNLFYLGFLFVAVLLCNIFFKIYEKNVTDGSIIIDKNDPKNIAYRLEINEYPDTFPNNSIMTIKVKYKK